MKKRPNLLLPESKRIGQMLSLRPSTLAHTLGTHSTSKFGASLGCSCSLQLTATQLLTSSLSCGCCFRQRNIITYISSLRDGMGFSLAKAQCLVAPPYAAAALVMFTQAYYADKMHLRGPTIVFNATLGLIGLPLLGFAANDGVRYFGVFLATICANANVPAVLTYQANNIRGQWKRAFSSASLVGFGGIGGIIGSTVFRDQDAPRYRPGIEACMIANGLILVLVALMTLKFWRANKRVERGESKLRARRASGIHSNRMTVMLHVMIYDISSFLMYMLDNSRTNSRRILLVIFKC
jgi:hypothetical protein